MEMRFRFTWSTANDSQEVPEDIVFAATHGFLSNVDPESPAQLLFVIGLQELADDSFVTSVSFFILRPPGRTQFSTYLQWHEDEAAMVEYLGKNPERLLELWNTDEETLARA